MKYFSTFSGIGGFELGITQAYEKNMDNRRSTSPPELAVHNDKSDTNPSDGDGGWTNPTCVGYSEIDKYAAWVYNKHFPNHKNYGDITRIDPSTIPDFDLFVGGFPCQAFSIAGKRMGFSDTRGTLFFDIARILRVKKPKLVLLENVKGLLNHDTGKTFEVIISTLSELGYSVEWQVLNSKNFGVPQNRERVFIIGHLGGFGGGKVFPIGEGGEEAVEQRRGLSFPTVFASQHKIARGMPMLKVPEATKKGYAVAKEGDSINLSVPNSKTRRGRVGKGIAQTIDTGMQQHTLQNSRIRRLTPTECCRLQGFPDTWCDVGIDDKGQEVAISDTQKYKVLGNAVTTNVIQAIVEKLLTVV